MNKSLSEVSSLLPLIKDPGWWNEKQGLNNSLVVDTIIQQQASQGLGISSACKRSGSLPRMGWLWTESRRTNRKVGSPPSEESERTSRQMEEAEPSAPDTSHCCPLKNALFALLRVPGWTEFSQGDAECPAALPMSARIDLLPELMWYPYRQGRKKKKEKARSSAMCLFFKGTNPSLGPHSVTWLPLNSPTS